MKESADTHTLHPTLKRGVQAGAKHLPKEPKPTKEVLATAKTAKASHAPKGGGHQEVNHAWNFSFLYTRVAGEFSSCSA